MNTRRSPYWPTPDKSVLGSSTQPDVRITGRGSVVLNGQEYGRSELLAVSALGWAMFGRLQLVGGQFETRRHEFQADMLQCDARRQCACKATQMAFTETAVIKCLWGMIYGKYPRGILYLFPTGDDVADFSSSRFQPLIKDNPELVGRYVSDTNRTNLKRVGGGYLYFRGARIQQRSDSGQRQASKLKSIPVDKVVFDELDEMSVEAVDFALARMKHSDVREEYYLGNPTIPDYGIDRVFQGSDQRYWHLRCPKCGKYTAMELEFPECLHRRADGSVIRLCVRCRSGELDPADGKWIALFPEREKDMVGWSVSHLVSQFEDMGELLDTWEDSRTDMQAFYNLQLGKAYIAAENRLTVGDVMACCGADGMAGRDGGPCAMGVDVGKQLHVVIGKRPNHRTLKVVKVARVDSFNDLHDLARRFGVQSAVLDKYPETRRCRRFAESEPYPVYLCGYQEGRQKGMTDWDEKVMEIYGNRTELCDASHELVVEPGRLELPRPSEEVKEYARQMCNIAKVLEEDPATGGRFYSYRRLGRNDHFRHATNYLMLASERVGVSSESGIVGRFFKQRQRRTWMTV